MFNGFELEDYNRLSTGYRQELYRLIQFRTTGFYRVKIEDLCHLLYVPKSYSHAKMDQKVFSKSNKSEEKDENVLLSVILLHLIKKNLINTKLTTKKEERLTQLWKSDESESMPTAITQTEYQNPELQKEKEATKHNALLGDFLKNKKAEQKPAFFIPLEKRK